MSPFKSRAQMKFMFAKKPELAKKWAKKYGVPSKLPEKLKGAKRKSKGKKGGILK